MSEQPDFRTRYIGTLQALVKAENRAALAALRRGLASDNGVAPELHRYVVPWLGPNAHPRDEEPFYQVAALFAWHQKWWEDSDTGERRGQRNFGASCAFLARKLGRESFEQRFVALLDSHRDDLFPRLRNMVGLLRANNIPVDWSGLLADIQGWDYESRSVQRAWARAYWRAGSARDEQLTESDTSESEA